MSERYKRSIMKRNKRRKKTVIRGTRKKQLRKKKSSARRKKYGPTRPVSSPIFFWTKMRN
jgi:hypothetical protein